MLERARERVVRQGWENVHLIQGDASRISLYQQFDGALCTLAMSVIPDYESALKVMVNHVRPGGRVAIADAKFSTNWYARPFNWFANLLGRGAAADIKRSPWVALNKLVDDFIYRQLFMGFFYLAAGRVPD
jgi:ubiquinone/menaquinone biosynthesis C-methylase UbiE